MSVTFFVQDSVAVISIDNPPVNALSQSVREGILTALSRANNDATVKTIVIACTGNTFVAGADIKEFGKPPMEPHLPDVLIRLERSNKPVVVALHGNALGGGLELAMSAHYRVASRACKLGLPEVNLGLIPGAGGTQRLPRLVGIESALNMVTSAKPITAARGFDNGLIDELLDAGDADSVLRAALDFATDKAALAGPRKTSEQSVPAIDDDGLFDRWRAMLAKKARGQDAPQAAINAVENSLTMSFEDAVAKEREYFLECKASPQSRAMRHAFFAERSCGKIPGLDKSADPKPTDHVGVIGAGTMGSGIAMCFASAGIRVTLLELSAENLQRGLALIRQRYQQSFVRGRISEADMNSSIERIRATQEFAELADVDLVVEAAFESMQVKREIFSQLDEVCKPEAILATNTSYLNINEIASATNRPEQVLGMHFFSPAHVMKLLEVINAEATNDRTLLTAMKLGKRIGKIACAVGVCYGFVGNRMYSCYGREANALLLEGVTPTQIDLAMQNWGMAMGPLAVTDMSGIDVGYKARQERTNPPDDPLYFRAAAVMVEHQRYGQKTSAGFYDYENGEKQSDEKAVDLIRAESARLGIAAREVTDEEIQQRLTLAMINEGARILDEGIALRASDIDVIWLNGYGFPRWRGGPMCYADEVGLDQVLKQLEQIHSQAASEAARGYWEPARLIRKLAASGEKILELSIVHV